MHRQPKNRLCLIPRANGSKDFHDSSGESSHKWCPSESKKLASIPDTFWTLSKCVFDFDAGGKMISKLAEIGFKSFNVDKGFFLEIDLENDT